MRKWILPLLIVIVFTFCSNTFAATKEDVIAAINATYPVGNDTYRLPQSVIDKAVNAVKSKNLTPEQCDKALGLIGRAVAVAQRAGTTDITKVSKEDLQAGLSILREASGAAKMDLTSGITASIPSSDNKSSKETSIEQSNDSTNNDIAGVDYLSGENLSGDTSGETVSADVSEESLLGIMSLFMDSSGDNATIIDKTVETHSKIAFIVLILILFLNILIIYLLFKSKWNKITKYILIIIFVILFLFTLFVLGVALCYIEELKMIYKLYYMFK